MDRQPGGAERPGDSCDPGSRGDLDAKDRIDTPSIAPRIMLRPYELPRRYACAGSSAHGTRSSPPSGELPTSRYSGCETAGPYNDNSLFTLYRRQTFAIFRGTCQLITRKQLSQLFNPPILRDAIQSRLCRTPLLGVSVLFRPAAADVFRVRLTFSWLAIRYWNT